MTTGEPLRLTRAQVRELDRRAIEQYHVPGVVLMENAARGVVDAAMEMLAGTDTPKVAIVCGGGNNGGDGLAVARHLHNRGAAVRIVLAVDPHTYRGDAAINWRIVQAMNLPLTRADDLREVARHLDDAALTIDALYGTGLQSAPRNPELIETMNSIGKRILAVDLPSGIDCDTGEAPGARVVARRTVTFVAEKAGFANPASRQYTGQITVADIGCPRELVEEVGRTVR